MLEQVLDFIHNYFVKEVHSGKFVVEGGQLSGVDFLLDGQYFLIKGSVFNDGVHQYPCTNLTDEEFEGEIQSMAVPQSVLSIADEIDDWVDSYGTVQNSPYSSESFGGYSYTKAQGGSGSAGGGSSWQSVFGSRLNRWRKIS